MFKPVLHGEELTVTLSYAYFSQRARSGHSRRPEILPMALGNPHLAEQVILKN